MFNLFGAETCRLSSKALKKNRKSIDGKEDQRNQLFVLGTKNGSSPRQVSSCKTTCKTRGQDAPCQPGFCDPGS